MDVAHLSYLNFHRPCAQDELVVDQKRAHTPHLPSLPDATGNPAQPTPPAQYLRVGFTADALKQMAAASSDTEAARRMQEAKRKLFDQFATPG